MDGYDVEFWTLLNSVLNVKALVGAFNQEKAPTRAVSRILHHSHPYFIYEVIMKHIWAEYEVVMK